MCIIMEKTDKLIIVGDSAFAEIAYEYFTHDSNYNVIAFSVEKAYLKKKELFGLPIVPFEKIESIYNVEEHKIFVAITYRGMNRLRTRLYQEAKTKGFSIASYVSSNAFVWHNVTIGENCFIFEDNVIQPFVSIGNNVIIWSGNHIGHHSTVSDNCFIASHLVISGYVLVHENCFLGVNATISNNLTIAKDSLVGAGALIVRDTEEGKTYFGPRASVAKKKSLEYL